ncbi:MAG: hypothetical protein IID17_11575 [Nitrospinae bacterium]|nr:hypothetical protein [Nitrospinota bacterium]
MFSCTTTGEESVAVVETEADEVPLCSVTTGEDSGVDVDWEPLFKDCVSGEPVPKNVKNPGEKSC